MNGLMEYNQTLRHNYSQSFQPNGTYDYCLMVPEDPICDYDLAPFQLTTGKIVSATIMALLTAIALGGNVLLCTAFLFYRRLRKTTNYFIISLAISDMLVASVAMPMWISYELTGWLTLPHWVNFGMMYKFWLWLDILSGVSSIANLAGISIDRFFSILSPLLHRTRMTSSLAIGIITIAWVYSLVLASLSFAELRYYTLIISVMGFFLPLSIIIASYLAIYCKVKFGFLNSHPGKDWNLERTILIVIFVFAVCWLPFFTFTLLYHYCRQCHFDKKSLKHIVSFTKWMHYLNSCCNPFIYGVFNTNFKMAFKALLYQCFGKGTTTAAIDSDATANESATHGIMSHIRNIGRKLRYPRRSNKNGGLLLTESGEGESGMTMLSVTISPGCKGNELSNNPNGVRLMMNQNEEDNDLDTTESDTQQGQTKLKEIIVAECRNKYSKQDQDESIDDENANNGSMHGSDEANSSGTGERRSLNQLDLQNIEFIDSQESNV
eukprot:gene5414-6090_t